MKFDISITIRLLLLTLIKGGAWHKMRFCARLVVSQVGFLAGEI